MIGIISAMQEEIHALLNKLENVSISEKGLRKYYTGTLFHKKVVIVFSRMGKVASATTTTQLINDFDIDELIFTGVAGAIKQNLNIGDVVIGKCLFQHDMDLSPFYKPFEIPLLNIEALPTKNAENLFNATENFLNSFNLHINKQDALLFNIKSPKVIIGDIASGDQFIKSTEKIKLLNETLPSTLCVEMEGAAVAQVCYEYKMPFSIIRIISDKATNNEEIDFLEFSKSIASNYTLGILKNYFV